MKLLNHILLLVSTSASFLMADSTNIAAASDLQYAFKDIKVIFDKKYPKETINFQFGSSGKALTQITNGAPYDVYFSADMNYPKELKAKGFAVGEIKPYALGRIGFMTLKSSGIKITNPSMLLDPKIKKIAIANPEHAPYGKAAVASLKKMGIYEKVKNKFIMGENIQQAAQFVQSGSAEVGIIAYSVALAPSLKSETNYTLIDSKMHPDILQGYALLTHGENNSAAKAFIATVESKEGNAIMQKYGFVLK